MIAEMTQREIIEDSWTGLYRERWKDLIVPDAIAHPAKFARALIRQIYTHAIGEGWLKAGDLVCDPFGGVALGAHHAIQNGLHWTGCELEPRFVALGEQNIKLWMDYYGPRLACCGSARLIQGDSRQLASVIAEARAVVSSPPFVGCGAEGDGRKEILQKAFNASGARDARPNQVGDYKKKSYADSYGKTSGQLGNLKEGDINAVIGSPPFVESLASDDPDKRGGLFRDEKRRNDKTLTATYGESDGQLGRMKEDSFDAVVSSPPYDGRPLEGGTRNRRSGNVLTKWCEDNGRNPDSASRKQLYDVYGETEGNVGNLAGDTFWSASRQILEQCFQVLAPGAHAIWVLKGFVRDKQYVDFPDQWRRLCEAVGFETLHLHKAWLVEEHGEQGNIFGEADAIRTESKSFFRRLAESKGSPRIDFEVVLCTRKP